MTVSSEVSSFSYATDGVTTSFPVPFYFLAASDLRVWLHNEASDSSTDLELGNDYDVTGAGQASGGAVVTRIAHPPGLTLRGERLVPITQETAYQRNDPFPERAHEKALDKLTMIAQQIASIFGMTSGSKLRALLVPFGESVELLPKQSLRANRALGFDANGDPIAIPSTLPEVVGAVERAEAAAESAEEDAGIASAAAASASADAVRAETAADAAAISGLIYPDTETAITGAPPNWPAVADGMYFEIVSPDSDGFIDLYRNVAGVAVYVDTYPNKTALDAMAGLIGPSPAPSYYELIGEDRFVVGKIYQDGADFPGFGVNGFPRNEFFVRDRQGFGVMSVGERDSYFGPLHMRRSDGPEWRIIGEDRFVLLDALNPPSGGSRPAPAPSAMPYLSQLICGASGVPQSLYMRNMLAVRSDTNLVRGTLSANAAPFGRVITSDDEIRFDVSEFGPSATLTTRAQGSDGTTRTWLPLTMVNVPVPVPGPAPAPKILTIGDSISVGGLASILGRLLTDWGFAPAFMGTVSASIEPGGMSAVSGEARGGWEGGDFTYAVDDKALIVEAGAESAYLAMPNSERLNHNPFLRAATGSDSAAIVRNGYVFDPVFYASRFGLDAPDIVLIGWGTNDARDRPADEIYGFTVENDGLVYSQIRAAWPSAKIIRWCPGTVRHTVRDALWKTSYIPMLRALIAAARTASVPVAPIWAMSTQEVGYTYSTDQSVDADLHAVTAEIGDVLHPRGPARWQMARALAPYVAAAALNLI
ncbi:SGNH/GDSL hydrolase family protein [Bordetella trematum]|uniref:SGNH/GDSL hydrolase family protein n=1 Tax=Bordetella trematum TaxID=123899 RepID=UPI00046F1F65|nr:SGNH/GDSL hydrolase family protein [Bordetella trematum]